MIHYGSSIGDYERFPTHISLVHAALYGLGILSPSSNICKRVRGLVAG